MNAVPKIAAGATWLFALGLTLGATTAGLAQDANQGPSQTLSIGLPPADSGATGQPAIRIRKTGRENLHLEYSLGQFSLDGGRISPAVGVSWERPPARPLPAGTESKTPSRRDVAVSAGVEFDPDRLGRHRLSGGATFLDLSSFQTAPARGDGTEDLPLAGPRPGATDLRRYSITLEGDQLPIAPDLSYHIGFVQRPAGRTSTTEEAGFAAGIAHRFDLPTGIVLTPSIEAARMSDGTSAERDYFAASMLTEWRNWNLTLSYGRRNSDGSAVSVIDDYEAGASIGYVFDSGITADLGWERQKHAEEIADHIGFQFKYRFGFGR